MIKEKNKYQEAFGKIKYYEVNTSQGDEPLYYMLSKEIETLQELIDNSQQPNVQELIEKYEKIGDNKNFIPSFPLLLNSIIKDLKSIQQPQPKSLEEKTIPTVYPRYETLGTGKVIVKGKVSKEELQAIINMMGE